MIANELCEAFFESFSGVTAAHPEYRQKIIADFQHLFQPADSFNSEIEFRHKLFSTGSRKRNYFTISSKESFNDLPSGEVDLQWGAPLIYTPLNDHSRNKIKKGDILFCYRQGQFDNLNSALNTRGIYGLGFAASEPEMLFPGEKDHNRWGVLVCFPVRLPRHLALREIQMHPATIDLTPYNGNRNDALQYIPEERQYITLLDMIYSANREVAIQLQNLLPEVSLSGIDLPSPLLNRLYARENVHKDNLMQAFEKWFVLPENFKKSYAGLVNVKVMSFWDKEFFGNKLFKVDTLNHSASIQAIRDMVFSLPDKDQAWASYNSATNKGAPQAVLGDQNYIKFLQEFFEVAENRKHYSETVKPSSPGFIATPKPFILLAGISGTGKTRFVKEQAKASWLGELDESGLPGNYCVVPVRPDWHEPSDLLGYISRINGVHFVATEFLSFMVRAWGDATNDDGSTKTAGQKMIPFWLCLDEMNLAPVEQYFADYLSILEMRQWKDGVYYCPPLLKPSVFSQLAAEDALDALRVRLFGIEPTPGSKEMRLWDRFVKEGIPLPPNLIVAGTVNMDETTHGFSRKVIDRALTFDFGEFFPNDYESFLPGDSKAGSRPKTFSFPVITSGVDEGRGTLAPGLTPEYAELSRRFMNDLNSILKRSPFELAYRALNEMLLSVACLQPGNEDELAAVWDDFIMQKVLPRIEGDTAKLRAVPPTVKLAELMKDAKIDEKEFGKGAVLHDMYRLLQNPSQLGKIWGGATGGDLRPDLLQVKDDGSPAAQIGCRTRKKLEWMMRRLKANHFTDFWV